MFPKNSMVKYRKDIEATYTGKCIITEHQKVKKANGSTGFSDAIVYSNVPCRLSFSTVSSANQNDSINSLVQTVRLFISPDISIKPGSKITVTQDGVTADYTNSGMPAHYATHQEIVLDVFKRWA